LSGPPKYAMSDAAGIIRGKSAIKMLDKPGSEETLLASVLLDQGHCVSTVGLSAKQIKEYVENQLEYEEVRRT